MPWYMIKKLIPFDYFEENVLWCTLILYWSLRIKNLKDITNRWQMFKIENSIFLACFRPILDQLFTREDCNWRKLRTFVWSSQKCQIDNLIYLFLLHRVNAFVEKTLWKFYVSILSGISSMKRLENRCQNRQVKITQREGFQKYFDRYQGHHIKDGTCGERYQNNLWD